MAERLHYIGQYYTYNEDINETYILANCDGGIHHDDSQKVGLICVQSGRRWTDLVFVEDVDNISPDEFESIAGEMSKKFKLLGMHEMRHLSDFIINPKTFDD